ncbi:MAG: hypothetical protein N3A54_04825 [Patescibacteria group bacterium]|nr:hypothetical protein [Patescibacteria group bacterium]
MKKKHFIFTFGFLFMLVGSAVLIFQSLQSKPSENPQQQDNISQESEIPQEQITDIEFTITGKIVCLPHKNPSEIQTTECAYGLEDEAGNYYGLEDPDPAMNMLSQAPMNERVKVSGLFREEQSDKYPIIGVIQIQTITKNETVE